MTNHSHYDHWQVLDAVVAATGARSVAPALDAPEIPSRPDELVEDGDGVKVGACELEQICFDTYMRSHWQWLVGAGAGIVTAILVFVVTWQTLGQHKPASGMPAWFIFLGIVAVAGAFGLIARLGHRTGS